MFEEIKEVLSEQLGIETDIKLESYIVKLWYYLINIRKIFRRQNVKNSIYGNTWI